MFAAGNLSRETGFCSCYNVAIRGVSGMQVIDFIYFSDKSFMYLVVYIMIYLGARIVMF